MGYILEKIQTGGGGGGSERLRRCSWESKSRILSCVICNVIPDVICVVMCSVNSPIITTTVTSPPLKS